MSHDDVHLERDHHAPAADGLAVGAQAMEGSAATADDDTTSQSDADPRDGSPEQSDAGAQSELAEKEVDDSVRILSEILARAAALAPGSVGAVDALLADVIAAGLPAFAFKNIAQTIARAAVVDADVVKKRLINARAATDTAAAEKASQTGGGAKLSDPDPDPAPMPIADLLDAFADLIDRRVVCSPETRDAVALWSLATWGVRPLGDPDNGGPDLFPLLYVGAPAKRCGKSTMLETIGTLTRRPVAAADISVAALFRIIDARRPTLLIDEFDRLIKRLPDIIALLNSAHTRSGSVIRTVETVVAGKKVFEPTEFASFTPIAMAGIGRAPGTIADRSVRVWLERQLSNRRSARVTIRDLGDLRRKLAPHCIAYSDAIGKAMAMGVPDALIPASLNDRDADGWQALFGLAQLAGVPWPARVERAAKALCKDDDEGLGSQEWRFNQIVEGIEVQRREVVDAYMDWRNKGRPSTSPLSGGRFNKHITRDANGRPLLLKLASSDWLAEWLLPKEDSGFADANSFQSVKARVARDLAPYKIKPEQRRVAQSKYRGYDVAAVRAAWRRYKPKR